MVLVIDIAHPQTTKLAQGLDYDLNELLLKRNVYQPTMGRDEAVYPEKRFRDMVKQFFEARWWLVNFVWNSQHSTPGFSDIVAIPHPVMRLDELVVVAELKTNRSGSKTTQPQRLWMEAFKRLPNVAVFEWRPVDWPTIDFVATLPSITYNVVDRIDLSLVEPHMKEHALTALNMNVSRPVNRGGRPTRRNMKVERLPNG
jgi:hypothetical protein